MSHRIIISSNQNFLGAADVATSIPEIDYNITYAPDHALTPAQQGAKVGQILKLVAKMQEPVGE